MTNREAIEVFFSRSVEKTFNDSILDDKNYVIPHGSLDTYLDTILSVPYSEYIDYLRNHKNELTFSSLNISQFSSFSACEIEMCNVLIWNGNPGLTNLEIGKLFPDYVQKHNDTAYLKFGENQIKTAAQLGLAFEYYGLWFLSCIGYVYPHISDERKARILARLILRDSFYANIVLSLTEGDVDLLTYMESELSPKTSARRYSNVVTIVKICIAECQREGIVIGAIKETKKLIPTNISAGEYKIVAGKTILFECQANKELFETGFIIPESKHDLWKRYLGVTSSQLDELRYINLIIDKKPFKALIGGSLDSNGKPVMQVYYEDTPAIAYLIETFNVSYSYIKQSLEVPLDKSESITVYAANRNDTLYVSTNTVGKRIEESIMPTAYQNLKDLDYYKGCFRDIAVSRDNKKYTIGKLCMILALAEYVQWLDEYNDELSNKLPILGTWEGNFLKIFSQYFSAKRTSTLFSSPFLMMNEEPFWQIVKEDGKPYIVAYGERAIKSFSNIQETFDSVIIDNELLSFLKSKDTCSELCEYVQKLLKKL